MRDFLQNETVHRSVSAIIANEQRKGRNLFAQRSLINSTSVLNPALVISFPRDTAENNGGNLSREFFYRDRSVSVSTT